MPSQILNLPFISLYTIRITHYIWADISVTSTDIFLIKFLCNESNKELRASVGHK